jgi:hypothetical protein
MSHPLPSLAGTPGITIVAEQEQAVPADLRLLLRLGGEIAAAVDTGFPDQLDSLPLDRLLETS